MANRYFDCHTHLFPERRMGGLMRWIHRAIPDFEVPVDITADQGVEDLRAAGAVRWANLLFPIAGGEAVRLHRFNAALADRVPEITPFGGVHVDDDDPRGVLEEALDGFGMAGLKFHPFVQGFFPWDHRLASMLELMDERGVPMFVHTGYDEWYGASFDRDGLETMLSRFPSIPVVLPHIGFPDIDWAFALADRHPQVWLDLTNVPGSLDWMPEAVDDAWRERLSAGAARHRDRTLVGTDYPAGMGGLDTILASYRAVGFEDGLLEHLMVVSTRAFFERFGRTRP